MSHISVLLHESVDGLNPKDGGVYVDATLGLAGHSTALASCAKSLTIIGIDADADAIETATERMKSAPCTFIPVQSYNDRLTAILAEHGIAKVDGVLLDLGMSSPQIDTSRRGFSFMKDEPLLMTMQREPSEHALTAEKIVNTFTEEQLATIIYGYGEEQFSRRIARAIVEERTKTPLTTTKQLASIIASAVPGFYRHGKRHPATKTFQALRMTVNDELTRLEATLNAAFTHLKESGRLVVISFHSLEDRIVKRFMRERVQGKEAIAITKKPIIPSKEETEENTRARSAKLRIIEKK